MIGQIVLMRELIVLFNGNELSLGIMLATWLVWTAAGSSLTGRLVHSRFNADIAVAVGECLCGLSLPLTVWALRSARVLFEIVPGELLGPVPMLLITLVCLSGFCGLSGSLFVLAARMYERRCAVSGRLATSYAYLLETAGSGLGGVLTSILLLRIFGSFQIAIVVALLNLGVAASLLLRMRRRQVLATAMACALLAFPLLAYVAPHMEESTEQRFWAGWNVVASRESIYGRITVTEAGGMRGIYEDGSILANVPDPATAEESVHYALLEHPAPQHVLLIGGGMNGGIAEALKHPTLERLDYVELDPALPAMYQRFFPAEYARSFSYPRVHVHYADGRLYLKAAVARFDAILVSVPDPQTAQLNRFFTAEFFQSAREHLASGGLLALQLSASENYISPQLAEFLRCIHRTLRTVFPYVVILPGSTVHFFAATQPGVLTDDPQVLISRLQGRNLQTLYVREYFIPFRMMPDRMAEVREQLQPLPETPVNRDFKPAAYYFGAVLWSAQFHSSYARALETAAHIRFLPLLAGVTALFLLFIIAFALFASPKRARVTAVWSVCATGYALMALQILLLLAFQSIYGYVYGELAMLIGMFMAGIAAGSWLGIARFHSADQKSLMRAAAVNQSLLTIAAPLLLFLVSLLARGSGAGASLWIAPIAFPALAVLCGMPGGFQFPIATEIYLRGRETSSGTGTLYALDLVGGCAGALLIAGFLIPVFGFWNAAWLGAAINLAPALLAMGSSLDSATTARQAAGAHQRLRQ